MKLWNEIISIDFHDERRERKRLHKKHISDEMNKIDFCILYINEKCSYALQVIDALQFPKYMELNEAWMGDKLHVTFSML